MSCLLHAFFDPTCLLRFPLSAFHPIIFMVLFSGYDTTLQAMFSFHILDGTGQPGSQLQY